MEFEIHSGEDGSTERSNAPRSSLVLPGDALPGLVHVLPARQRPVFPGQALPLVLDAATWIPTLKALQERGQNVIGVLSVRDDAAEVEDRELGPRHLYGVGTICRIHRIMQSEGQLHLLLEGIGRFRVRQFNSEQLPLFVSVQHLADRTDEDPEAVRAYAVAIINIIKELVPLNPLYGEELKVFLTRSSPDEPSLLGDFAASLTSAHRDELQKVLETVDVGARLRRVLELMQQELGIARTQQEIRQHVENKVQGQQREMLLRQQLKYIQKELGIEKDDKTAEIEEFRARIEDKTLSEAARKRFDEEIRKLSVLEPGSPEFGVTRNYLDWLTALPWGTASEDTQDLSAATAALDASHEGLEDVKERITEFLAVGMMRGEMGGSILLFVGPPGVGKTSLGKSIAAATGRRFHRFSLGGMRDEAEIKGHRRTYVGALPGKLVQALKECGTQNPVIMLDEVDKVGASFQGDPASALLEVLDPEQNASFRDHYLDLDVDLSQVLFVCTANQLDTIPGPLLDRMEIVHLSGYLAAEKVAIAEKHLIPRLLSRAGLRRRGDVRIHRGAVGRIVEGYARESGVRRLEKALARIVRKAVVKLLDGAARPIKVTAKDLHEYLGRPAYLDEERIEGVGIVTGLAWTAAGGATLPVEATAVHRRQAELKLTGQLGEVMKESAQIAYSFAASRAERVGGGSAVEFLDTTAVHLHVPAGATPKDGPSAGITMATALLSLASGRKLRARTAMTGELTLNGHVFPVGGIREKLLAARRSGVKHVILPEASRAEFEEVPASVTDPLKISFVRHFDEVIDLCFPERVRP